ncbi:DUF1120 domain-containing protein [uncultured Ralstonia sp.]|jgi:type 1 fimbria pilin|uniref:DUF1120 domain-containing protein n=2 Tax=Ralstonia TaxID=48736 RepID=UPI001EABCE09|nr:DUF1120 domain-containing protein [uncultured Ralstonia sp.]UCF25080.1 MAG: DUF1120 domain-containing protein [Ralstonia sp.]
MQIQNMRKALVATAVGGLFAMAASSAFAADTAELTVKGTIIPSACTANFAGGGNIDFGTIKIADLKANEFNKLPSQTTSLTVSCQTAKQVQFTVTDSQDGTAIDAQPFNTGSLSVYGLGAATVDGKQVKLGGYSLVLGTPTADGKSMTPIMQNGSRWQTADFVNHAGYAYGGGEALYNYDFWKDAFKPSSDGWTATAKVMTYPLTINASLNKGSELQFAEDTKLNGQAVFNISYN